MGATSLTMTRFWLPTGRPRFTSELEWRTSADWGEYPVLICVKCQELRDVTSSTGNPVWWCTIVKGCVCACVDVCDSGMELCTLDEERSG